MTVAVLAFHAVESSDTALAIDAERFARIVDSFHRRDYVAVTAAEVVAYLDRFGQTPERTVVFTFDDGYRSVYENALPLLDAAGFVATVFPVTAALGQHNAWDDGTSDGGLELMRAEHIQQLVQAGWEIGGHTHRHRRLDRLDAGAIREEVAANLAALIDLTGLRPRTFAYPFGCYSADAAREVAAHFDAAFTIGASMLRADSPRMALPRVEAWYVKSRVTARLLGSVGEQPYLALRRVARRAGERR